MSSSLSPALATLPPSHRCSSHATFARKSLTVAMFSALSLISLSASALTLDQANKTVTVDEAYTIGIVQENGESHARLFANELLADGASMGTPVASAEASGFTLNVLQNVTCPQGATEMACPVGAARLAPSVLQNSTTNNNVLNLRDLGSFNQDNGTKGASVFGGYIDILDKTDGNSASQAMLTANANHITANGIQAKRMQFMYAGYIYAKDFSDAQTGTLSAQLQDNTVEISETNWHIRNGLISAAGASINGLNAQNVNVLAENNTLTIHSINQTADLWQIPGRSAFASGLAAVDIAGSSGTAGSVTLTANNNNLRIESGTFDTLNTGIRGANITYDPSNSEVTATNNRVTILDGTFTGVQFVYGAGVGGARERTVVKGNSVTVEGGVFQKGSSSVVPDFIGAEVYPYHYQNTTFGPVVSEQNSVVLRGGSSLDRRVNGTSVELPASEHQLSENTVTITGGSWTNMRVLAGASSSGALNKVVAKKNRVSIQGDTVQGSFPYAYGVSISQLGTPTTDTQEVTAEENEVVLSGNFKARRIFGANLSSRNLSKANVQLINNKVTLSQNLDLANGVVAGAYVPTSDLATALSADLFTGNTLVLNNYTGTSKLSSVSNFEKYEFILPASHVVNESVALTTTTLSLDSPTNSEAHARIDAVSFLGEPRVLKAGDKIYLINADTINGTLANKDSRLVIDQGVTVRTRTLVRQEPTQIYLEVEPQSTTGGLGGVRPTTPTTPSDTSNAPDVTSGDTSGDAIPQEPVSQVKSEAKTFSEGYLAGALASVRAGDLVAGDAMTQTKLVKERFARWKGFGVASGIRGKYRTGSHIDTKDTSIVAGLLRGVAFDTANLTLGVFFEAGHSRYDTHNDVTEGGHGRGTVNYTGAGALVRLDAHNGLYAEASVRAGNARNKFDSSLVDALGRTSSYKANSNYFGFHLGAGYEWQMNDKLGGEVYTKYLFTRLAGDDVTSTTGDLLSFDSVTSQRLRVGGRVAYQMSERLTPYVGLGVEREFSAKSKATAFELPISAPSLTGTSGMAEVGLKLLEPQGQYGWSADVNLRGYFGTRQEIGGNLRVGYKF